MALANPLPCQRSPPSSSNAYAGIGAQPVDERLEMCESTKPPVAVGASLEIEKRKGVRLTAFRRYIEGLEKRLADQMRGPSGHAGDTKIDARLTEMNRQKLRMRIRHVQHTHITEPAYVIEFVAFDGARETRD
jgi:hypothetical protein